MKRLDFNIWLLGIIGTVYALFAVGLKMDMVSESPDLVHKFSVALLAISGLLHILFLNDTKSIYTIKMWLPVTGLFEIVIAICLAIFSDISILSLTNYLGIWAILRTVTVIFLTYSLRSLKIQYWKITLDLGVLALIFTFLFIFSPNLKGFTATDTLAWVFITLAVCYFRWLVHLRKLSPKQ